MEIILLLVGFVFSFFGVLIYLHDKKVQQKSHIYSGRVIGYNKKTKKKGAAIYAVVEYHSQNGEKIFINSYGSSSPFSYLLQQPVQVLAWGDAEQSVRILGSFYQILAVALLGIGLSCIAAFFATFTWSFLSIGSSLFIAVAIGFQIFRALDSKNMMEVLNKSLSESLSSYSVSRDQFQFSQLMSPGDLQLLWTRQRKSSQISCAILFILAAGLLCGSYSFVNKRETFLRTAQKANGKVSGLKKSKSDKTTTYAPIIEFRNPVSKERVTFTHSISSSRSSWRIGDPVSVLYDPTNPKEAMIDQKWMNWLLPVLPGLIGALFLLMGLHSWRFGHRMKLLEATLPKPPVSPSALSA